MALAKGRSSKTKSQVSDIRTIGPLFFVFFFLCFFVCVIFLELFRNPLLTIYLAEANAYNCLTFISYNLLFLILLLSSLPDSFGRDGL